MSEQSPFLHPEVQEDPEGVEPASETTQRAILDTIHRLVPRDSEDSNKTRYASFGLCFFPDSRMDITIYEPGEVSHDTDSTRTATISEVELNAYSPDIYLSRDYHCTDVPGGWRLLQDWTAGKSVPLSNKHPRGVALNNAWEKHQCENEQGFPAGLSGSELMVISLEALRGHIKSIPEEEYKYGLRMVSETEAQDLLELLRRIEDE